MTSQGAGGPYPPGPGGVPPQPGPGWGVPPPPAPGGYPPPAFGPPVPPGGPWGPPPPGGRSRKPLIVTLLASVAVLVVVGVIVAVVLGTGGHRGAKNTGSAGDAVKTYLEALARGDADAALAMALAEPASRKFLTNETLKQQIEHWPIKNIEVISGDSGPATSFALVKVAADFGGHRSQADIPVKKTGGVWKLESAAVNLETLASHSGDDPASTLKVLGKPLGKDHNFYVFPGYLGIESVPYVDVTADAPLLEQLTVGDMAHIVTFEYEINDTGRKAIQTAVGAWLAGCLMDPEHFYQCRTPTVEPPIKPETVKLTGPVDISGVTPSLRWNSLKATLDGKVSYTFTAEAVAGGVATFDAVQNLTANTAVDLAKEPPTVGPAF